MVLTWVKRVCMLWIFSSLSKVLKLVNSRLEQAAHRVWAWGVSSFCLSKLWRKKYIKLWDRWDEMRWDVLVNILRATSLWPGISGPGMTTCREPALLLGWKRWTSINANQKEKKRGAWKPSGYQWNYHWLNLQSSWKGQAAVSPLVNFCRAQILQVNLISVSNQVVAGLLNMVIVPIVLFTWLVRQSWSLGSSWK